MSDKHSRLRPRNDKVLLRVEKVTERDGLAVPQMSALSNKWTVVAAGPGAPDLNEGDEVLIAGKQNEAWAYVPGFPDLIVIDEANVLLVVRGRDAYKEALCEKVSDR